MHKSKKEKKVIQKTEETKIPTVFFYIDGKISKLIFEPDLDKLRKAFNVEIIEERGKHTKYTITSDDIKNCRKTCSVLEKIVNLLDRNIEPTEDEIDEFIEELCPKPYKETKYKGFFKTFDNEEVSPRTENQELIVDNIKKNTITIISGKAGSGKTKISIITALNLLKDGRYDSISIVRPTTVIGNSLGFIPGDLSEKYSVYTNPITENIVELIGEVNYQNMLETKKLKYVPLCFVRGATLNNTIIILDEIQNLSKHETVSLLTRIGINTKLICTGDQSQKDIKLSTTEKSGLEHCIDRLQDIDGIGFVKMQECDIQRNKLVGEIIRAFE